MRKILLFLFLLLFVFAGSFALSRMLEKQVVKKEDPFAPAHFALKNRPFTVVIVGYNNGAYVEKTLSSVFSLNYDNFRLIYIDDASNDGSFEVARDFICDSDHVTHVTLVKNEERLGILANVYRAVIGCPDEEIIVLLKGEDWFAHEWVLQRLNAYYENPTLWASLSQSIDYPSYELTPSPNLTEGRKSGNYGSHLKSFYAGLFKRVRESDFVYGTAFLKECADLSLMSPIYEMAQHHFFFIPEVLSVANQEVIEEKDLDEMAKCESIIRSIEPYTPLMTLKETALCGD